MSERSDIEIDVRVEQRDYMSAVYSVFFSKLSVKLLLGIGAMSLLLLLFVVVVGQDGAKPKVNVGNAIFVPIAIIGIATALYFGAKRSLASNKALQENMHYTFSDEGVKSVSPSTSGYVAWQNFYKAVESKSNFLLFISRDQMYVIPKRFFRDAGQILSLKKLLRAHLASRAKLK